MLQRQAPLVPAFLIGQVPAPQLLWSWYPTYKKRRCAVGRCAVGRTDRASVCASYRASCDAGLKPLREFVYMRRDASSRAFSRWRMRCAQPIYLSYHPGLVESSIFSRPGVLPTVPSEIFGQGQVNATESHLTKAHFGP